MRGWLRRRPFRAGLLAGILAVFAARAAVNATPVADWLVAPLLVPDVPAHGDAIVVLGGGVIGSCEPNQNALRRTMIASGLWHEGRAPFLLISGGTGGDICPVAEAMARVARDLGVPPDKLRVETSSRNTHENAMLTSGLLRGWRVQRVVLVTDQLHMSRAQGAFSRAGITTVPVSVPIYQGHEDNVSMLVAGAREYLALGYYRVRGWWKAPPRPDEAIATEVAADDALLEKPPPPAGRGPLVLLGASYVAGWPLTSIGGVAVIKKGVGGEQSFEMVKRFDQDVVASAPRAVVLWGFMNDLFRSSPEDIEGTIARIHDSYTTMIAAARRHGITPILATEVSLRPMGTTLRDRVVGTIANLIGRRAYQDYLNRHADRVNSWIIDTARRERLLVLDFETVLHDPETGRRHLEYTQPDGSHITAAGYKALTTYVTPILEDYLVAR